MTLDFIQLATTDMQGSSHLVFNFIQESIDQGVGQVLKKYNIAWTCMFIILVMGWGAISLPLYHNKIKCMVKYFLTPIIIFVLYYSFMPIYYKIFGYIYDFSYGMFYKTSVTPDLAAFTEAMTEAQEKILNTSTTSRIMFQILGWIADISRFMFMDFAIIFVSFTIAFYYIAIPIAIIPMFRSGVKKWITYYVVFSCWFLTFFCIDSAINTFKANYSKYDPSETKGYYISAEAKVPDDDENLQQLLDDYSVDGEEFVARGGTSAMGAGSYTFKIKTIKIPQIPETNSKNKEILTKFYTTQPTETDVNNFKEAYKKLLQLNDKSEQALPEEELKALNKIYRDTKFEIIEMTNAEFWLLNGQIEDYNMSLKLIYSLICFHLLYFFVPLLTNLWLPPTSVDSSFSLMQGLATAGAMKTMSLTSPVTGTAGNLVKSATNLGKKLSTP